MTSPCTFLQPDASHRMRNHGGATRACRHDRAKARHRLQPGNTAMPFNLLQPALVSALLLAAAGAPAHALTVAWGDWVNAEGLYGAYIDTPGGTVTAIYAGAANGLLSGPCIGPVPDYWAAGTYNGPANKPVCEALLFSVGGAKSISFSAEVENLYVAVANWDETTVLFDAPFELISTGPGHFGTGTPVINPGSTGFTGDGPVHAILRFNGPFSSLAFTDTDTAFPRFLTIGVGPGPAPVPEPASWAMLIAGFGLVGSAIRRRHSATARQGTQHS
jgi:hypothetical protein